jgi:hypothetical protein
MTDDRTSTAGLLHDLAPRNAEEEALVEEVGTSW